MNEEIKTQNLDESPKYATQEISQEEKARFNELCQMAFDFARNNEFETLSKMIDAGLSPNLTNEKGDSLLMLASYNGSFETTKMLLEKGAEVDKKNDRGQTPLAGVAFKGNLEIVKLLVENGANIDENNGLGMTPYSFAVMFGRSEVTSYLASKSKNKSLFKKLSVKILNLFRKNKI
ncbi:ankyrin repeat domain-containing protein [Campylobacter ureolyticus]|uniref:ankyrin repeat domain-containing protein n=1 Tax=Campylobacter ureolyticus TaxID=827 RepID=UPI0022B36F2D|nr:ankyrin repeat domain-containing protein [Campylobacter ureolyticus]MCZ6111310.1 ankyrin repeat domain-containing protein [Campylobacter ureolyticus]